MGNKDEGNSDLLLNPFQLVLHLLAEFQIQRRQRLVQQKHLRLIHQRSCDGNTLLLPAGKKCRIFIFVSLKSNELQHLHDLLVDDVLTHLLDFQSKSDIFIYTQMRKQGIFLKNRI